MTMRFLLLAAVWLSLSGCAGTTKVFRISPAFYASPPSKIAVLPFANQTNDLRAPEMLRKLVHDKLEEWGYPVADDAGVDEKLRAVGITDGGQLGAVKSVTLSSVLDEDGLCYGDVEDFTFQNLGFIIRRVVGLRLSVAAGQSGEILWEASDSVSSTVLTLNKEDAKKAFVIGMAEKAVENMAQSPLYFESKALVDRLFEKMPRR